MGVGISCKNGLNLHLGEMLTNYATNRFESRRRQKSSAIDQLNKSKSDSSLFSVVSTKSLDDARGDQFEPWKRRKDRPLDEHEASQVIYLVLPNNVSLFIEQLNCDLCSQRFAEENGGKEFAEQQQTVQRRLEAIIDQTINEADERSVGSLAESLTDNESLKTIKSMKLNTGELSNLDNQDLDFIEQASNYDEPAGGTTRRLSSIEEESHPPSSHLPHQESQQQEEDLKDQRRFLGTPRPPAVGDDDDKPENNKPENDKHEKDDGESPNGKEDQLSNKLPTRRSSVKVQMSSLEVPFSFASGKKARTNEPESKQRIKRKNFKMNSKGKQSLRFSIDSDGRLDEDSSDEQLKEIGLEEKQQILKEMVESAKREQFRQIENLSFANYSNSFNDPNDEPAESDTELIRSFSADYVRDLLTDQLLNDLVELDYIDYKLSKIGIHRATAAEESGRLMYASDTDLTKLKENQSDNISTMSTLRTDRLLNLDAIEKELLDRDQLENVPLDETNETEEEENITNRLNVLNRLNSMNSRLATNGNDGRLLNNFGSNTRSKFSLKVGLADYSLLTGKQLTGRAGMQALAQAVAKTKRREDLNKRSLVNSWLTREQFDQDDYNSLLSFNQSFSQPSSHPLSQSSGGQHQPISAFVGNQPANQFPYGQTNLPVPECTVDDCNLCRLNEEKLNELDSDVLQLMHVLQTLDEILQEKERQLQQLAEKNELSPSHTTLCASNKQKLVRSRANLKKKVNMLKKRSSRLGFSMSKNEDGKQLVVFRDGKSTYHIELGDRKSLLLFFLGLAKL